MILNCPKCKEWFELSSRSFRGERFNVSDYIACVKCGYLLPSMEFVGEARQSEFIDWINEYNFRRITHRERQEWEVVVYDRSLRLQLVKEGVLSGSAGDPALHLYIRCVLPDKIFILKKFKEYVLKEYKRGFIDPIVRIQPASIVSSADQFVDL